MGENLIDYPREFSTPTSDLITMKLNVNSITPDIKYLYMCMHIKYFYLNNHMYISDYIMIQISMIPQEFIIA